jgi:hypothetical protein
MAATGAVKKEFGEIKRQTEVGAGWGDEGVERICHEISAGLLQRPISFLPSSSSAFALSRLSASA